MEFRQLRYFIEVAEREHMSESANHLNVAQSAVSRQIANLEKELGVQLFERKGRNIKLLPIGRMFLVHAKEAIRVIEHAKDQIGEYIDPERGIIKIGFMTSLANRLLPQLLSLFKAAHPKIEFQLQQDSYQNLIDSVKDQDLNIALVGPVLTDDHLIDGDILYDEKLHLLIPKSHHLANRKSIYLRELKDEEFVLFTKGHIFEKIIVESCQSVGFKPTVIAEANDFTAIKGLVATGIGITILPESVISENDFHTDFTVRVSISNPNLNRTVGIITPKDRELTPSESIFRQFACNYFEVNTSETSE